ncbi:sensor histidine kinase [Pseudopedobacter beijingensis]|uniref:Sensor histidine kinase n=1 Tax=Pseudopedobacter beijingensis TaxID=1207056 RepID=A0ABW4IGW5_9SPHI
MIPFNPNMAKKPMFKPPRKRIIDIGSTFFFIIIIAIGLSYQFIRRWQYTEQKALRMEAEKVSAELSFLKAQINPHFLFNTLNNIYSLSVTGSKNTPNSIMQLSNIMHFITDKANSDFIPLQKEIEFIRDYINLQRLRLGKETNVIFDVEGKIEHQQVPPLIFISFIENAFKYGISKNQSSEILIKILVNQENISFRSINHIFPNNHMIESPGIGISNSRKRLQYLYPNRHRLLIKETEDLFIVHLNLNSTT